MRDPTIGYALLTGLLFVVGGTSIVAWARQSITEAPGRIARSTVHARVSFTTTDQAATENERQRVAQTSPRVYVAEEARFEVLEISIRNLPVTLAAASAVDDVAPPIRDRFALTQERFDAIRSQVVVPAPPVDESGQTPPPVSPTTGQERTSGDTGSAGTGVVEQEPGLAADAPPEPRIDRSPEPSAGWTAATDSFIRRLRLVPIVAVGTYQLENQSLNKQVALISEGRAPALVDSRNVKSVGDPQLEGDLVNLASFAGFDRASADAISSAIVADNQPTFRFDETRTQDRRAEAAAGVTPITIDTPVNAIIITRGEPVTEQALETLERERAEFLANAPAWRLWLPRLSLGGAVTAVAAAIAGYAALFNRRLRRNPDRMIGLAVLLLGGLAAAVFASAAAPQLWGLTVIAPTVLVTSILVIAYDQRTALAIGALHALLVCIALAEPVGTFATILTGLGTAVWTLAEIRDRRAIMRSGLIVSLVLTVTTASVAIVDRPLTPAALQQLVSDALLAGLGGLVTAAITLALVSSVENLFDIITGMTLIELRDPKQPLLRELQQRAPGTYNHSLNVASIAEQAADAIGANSLLTYVGALYHDVGKMNKPEYFVENQTPGHNRHENLSPAMSLLVIVGHVKDGVELAREYHLPRPLFHFIEAHHGTTLVEYFYHRAVQEAETEVTLGETTVAKGHNRGPEEFDYRYPGPKPATKEVAILMLSDAVESATRTLSEPNPSRIENLVRTIARKRLDDGQFDECAITLRELETVTDSIIKSLTAIYHGRIAYPSDEQGTKLA